MQPDSYESANLNVSTTADIEIRNSLRHYGEDVLLTKIPHFADGCKVIIRRILWFNRDSDSLRPMNKMVGDLQGVHTGGDSSIAEAILRLGQDFNVGFPLIEISGKSGEYSNPDAAADTRYLDAKLSKFAADVYFKGVNTDSFQMIPTKDATGKEPRYMVPKIPMALIIGNLTVGMGFKSQIYMISLKQVCAAVVLYSKFYRNGGIGVPDSKITAPYFIPGFPIKNIILNRRELLQAYKEGNYKVPIQLEGWVDIAGNSITMRNLPYGNNFGRVTNAFRTLLKNPKNKFKDVVDSANDYSSEEVEFTINLKSGKNPFAVLDMLRTTLRINDAFYPYFNYVRNERVIELTPPSLMYLWYKEREANIVAGLNHKHAQLNAALMRIEAILLVIDHSDDVIRICRMSDDVEDCIEELFKFFTKINLTRKQASIIARQPLSTFNKNAKRRLLAQREQILIDLDNVTRSYTTIHETISMDAEYIQKEYKNATQTLYSDDFIGHVQFGNLGLVNFFNYDEMCNILSSRGWSSSITKYIYLYNHRNPRKQIIRNGKVIELTYVSKEITCERMMCYPTRTGDELTLVISDAKSVSVIEHLVGTLHEGYTLCPITKQFYAIHSDGTITLEDYNNFSIRKSVSSGRKSNVIYGLPNNTKDVLIFHMNTTEPNQLRVSRILSGGVDSIKFVPTGETHILGVFPITDKDIILNIPKCCMKSVKLSHLFLHDIIHLFNSRDKKFFCINLSRGKNDIGIKLVSDQRANGLCHIDFARLAASKN